VLPHPPYSPELAKLKDSIRGTKFEDDDSLVASVKQCLRSADPEFYRAGMPLLRGGVRQLRETETTLKSSICS
jgi:hypothetical protein